MDFVGQQNHAGAGAIYRQSFGNRAPNGPDEVISTHEFAYGGAFTAGDHQTVERTQVGWKLYETHPGSEPLKRSSVFGYISLKREDSYVRSGCTPFTSRAR